MLTTPYTGVILCAMEKLNVVPLSATKHDYIDDVNEVIFQGSANYTQNCLSFQCQDTTYSFTKVSSHYVVLDVDGDMSFSLDLQKGKSFESSLIVDQFEIPIVVKTLKIQFSDVQWMLEYQIYQNDALIFHSSFTLDFLMS